MFGLKPSLPISEEERRWTDDGFARLGRLLGRERMLRAEVILPEPRYFPDPYDQSPQSARLIFDRLCRMLMIDGSTLQFEILQDEMEIHGSLPEFQMKSHGAAGMYVPPAGEDPDEATAIVVKSSHLDDPPALVSTLVHELCHVLLLGSGLLDAKTPDMEPLTDLATVYVGFGVFSANTTFRFHQYADDQRQGWSARRLGYLPEEVYGYALARFALERNEHDPEWAKHLTTNPRSYFKRSSVWLRKTAGSVTGSST